MCPLPLEAAMATVEAEAVSAAAVTTVVIVRSGQALKNAFVERRTNAFARVVSCG